MRSRTIAWLALVWPVAILADSKASGSSQLTSIVSSPAAAPIVKQTGSSVTPTASVEVPAQSRPYALPLTAAASARSVQSQYPIRQPVTGGAASVPHSAEVPGVPQLSVADILALRRAVQQSQLLSRSGVLAPSGGPLNRGGLAYGTGALLGQFGGGQFPGGSVSQFHDPYLASGSAPAGAHLAPPPAGNKNSISTRFRSFMNSLFFRRSTAASPAFYQGGPSPYGIPGASGASANPFGPASSGYHGGAGHSHGFSSKIFSTGSGSYNPQGPGGAYSTASVPGKSVLGSTSVASKPTGYQTSASSLISSVQKASVLPVPATSSSATGAGPVGRPSSSGNVFYPSAASAPGPSFDKTQFSSLYGTNGFTAKASPVGSSHPAKSSKSLKAPSGPTMETSESQLSPFQPVAAPGQQKPKKQPPQGVLKATITSVSASDGVKTASHRHSGDGSSNMQTVTSSMLTSAHPISHGSLAQISSSSELKDSVEQGASK